MTSDLVRRAADEFGGLTAMEWAGGSMSFQELDERVNIAVSASLPGRRVVVEAPRSAADIVRFLAVLRLGGTAILAPRGAGAGVGAGAEAGAGVGAGAAGQQTDVGRQDTGSSLWSSSRIVVPTSGSTGTPKAVVHTTDSMEASAAGAVEHLDFGPGGRWPVTLSMHHAGGLAILFRVLVSGGTLVWPRDVRDLEATIRGASHVSFVPTQLYRLLSAGSASPPPELSRVLVGGASASSRLVREAVRLGWPVVLSYGLSEMGSLVTATDVRHYESSGRVLTHRKLRISKSGEIEVGGAALFESYLDGPATEPWHPTGDLGSLDDLGQLHVTGRLDNMFISGGENIHPEIIEAAFLDLDGVVEAVVVPVEDAEYGARPVAFVEGTPSADSMIEALRGQLPGFLVPVNVFPLPAGPATGAKRNRAQLVVRARALRAGHI